MGEGNQLHKSTLITTIMEQARSFMDKTYAEGRGDSHAKQALSALYEKLTSLTASEDPFVIMHAFLACYRQIDFLDWRRSGETKRSERRRAGRIVRGEISGKRRVSREIEDEVEQLAIVPDNVRHLEDAYFPSKLSGEAALDALIESKGLQMDLADPSYGKGAILLSRTDASWAVYVAKKRMYVRVECSRSAKVEPRRMLPEKKTPFAGYDFDWHQHNRIPAVDMVDVAVAAGL